MKKARFLLVLLLGLLLTFVLPACSAGMPAGEPEQAPENTPVLGVETASAQPTATLGLAPDAAEPTLVPRITEQRRLTLEFPPTIKAGNSDNVYLTLDVDDLGNLTPTAVVDGNVITGETVEIPNLYDSHVVIAEARFDMAGVKIVPPEMISETLLPGEKVMFSWSVLPEEAGDYRGTVWLYLRFAPKDGGGELTRTISAQFIEINATTFMGLKAGPARWLGAIGTFISGVLGMPFFEEIVKWLWGKRG